MTLLRSVVGIVVALVLVAIAGAWWYFFGPNTVSAAQLVPGDSLVFAVIPNAAAIGTGYETSQLKKLVDSPNVQPLLDRLTELVGQKKLDLLKLFLPNLSGQSFVALTHFDPNKPDETGFVAGLKPKPGMENFDAFIAQVNATYPDLLRETTTGKGNLLGVDYQWIQGVHAPGRICVARYHGWIVTTWGEASLQDWLERMQGKPATPSLADNADYKKSLDRVGKDSQAIVYFDYRGVVGLWTQRLARTNPGQAAYLTRKLATVGGGAIGSRFEHGEIVDRFSVLQPRQAQLDNGMTATPCPFDTLKFTGPNTRFYLAANVNWAQIWKGLQDQLNAAAPPARALLDQLNSWAQSEHLDVQKNIIDPLGSEYSLQMEWDPDAIYPDLGFFLKVDKPDDFKPTIAAIVDTIRQRFATSAVITEINSNGHNYATLKTVRPIPFAPTITEDGPWFGLFLNEQHAVRSFARDESAGLLHNDDFNRQIGDKRQGATEIIFFDSPAFLDHAYRTALPYVSIGAMFNPTLAALLKDRQLPPDLTWLAPMGTWSAVISRDDDGMTGYSTSGIGNQGILMGAGLGGSVVALQMSGLLPRHHYTAVTPAAPIPVIPPPVVTPGANLLPNGPSPVVPSPISAAGTNTAPADNTTPSAPAMTNATSTLTPPPDAVTNPPPADTNPAMSNALTNTAPAETNAMPAPDAATVPTNAVPAPAPVTHSDANPPVTPSPTTP
jgi:hypothetical protein